MSALLSVPPLPRALVSCLIRLRRGAIDGKSQNNHTLFVSHFYFAAFLCEH